MLFTGLITAVVIVVCSVYIYYKFVLFNFWRKKGVFLIESIGAVTSLVTGKISIGELFRDAYLKHKNHHAVGIFILFKLNLVTVDLDLVRIILTREFHSFHDRGIYYNEKTDPLSGHLFVLTGKKWKNLRVKLTPTFTSGKLKQMFAILKECGEALAKSLDKITDTEESIEIKEILARYTTDVLMSVAFGIQSNCIEQPDNELRYWGKKIFQTTSVRNLIFVFAPQIAKLFSIPIFKQNITNFFINMFRDTVKYRQTHNVVRHDFMNLLIQLMEKGYVAPDEGETVDASSATNKLSMLEAAAQAFVFFLGGFETSSTTATHCLYELALNQDIQNKLRQEIDVVLKKHEDEVTYNAVNDMTYLHKVVSETLRKYPPLPVLTRVCTKSIDIPTTNIHIPEGTVITVPVLGVHYDPAIYPDPDKFDPERFNADQIADRHPYAYLPFGGGPRVCIGQRFGYMQAKVGIVSILSKFKVKLHSRTSVPLIFDKSFTVLTPKDGVHFIIKPR